MSARSGERKRLQRKSTLQPFFEQGETLHRATIGTPLTKRRNEVGGGSGSGSSSWSEHSSPSHSTGAAIEPLSKYLEYNVHAGDK